MKKFLLAHSTGESGDEILTQCLQQLGELPPDANFGFLYLSDHLLEQAQYILNKLKQATGVSHWVGRILMMPIFAYSPISHKVQHHWTQRLPNGAKTTISM